MFDAPSRLTNRSAYTPTEHISKKVDSLVSKEASKQAASDMDGMVVTTSGSETRRK
jgi:hypothetical protein